MLIRDILLPLDVAGKERRAATSKICHIKRIVHECVYSTSLVARSLTCDCPPPTRTNPSSPLTPRRLRNSHTIVVPCQLSVRAITNSKCANANRWNTRPLSCRAPWWLKTQKEQAKTQAVTVNKAIDDPMIRPCT
jgi:hypothetical protein